MSTRSRARSAERDERERAIQELRAIARGEDTGGVDADFERALTCEPLQRAHRAIAEVLRDRGPRSVGHYDIGGRGQLIEAPPGSLPPVG